MISDSARTPALLVAVAAAALTLAAPAGAVKTEKAKFKVEIFAEQHTDWNTDYTSTDYCTGSTSRTHGKGAQSMSLTTKQAVKVTALRNTFQGTRSSVVFFRGKPTAPKIGIPVNVAAIREGSLTTEVIDPGDGEACGDGDGGGSPSPPSPDCGPRSLKADVRLGHYEPELYPGDPAPLSAVLTLSGPFDTDYNGALSQQWLRCPGPANDSGMLMETPTGGLAAKKIFGKKKKFKVKAKDSETLTSSSGTQTTEVSWKVAFKRRGDG